MTRETLGRCLGFLENMLSQQDWKPTLIEMYAVVLQPLTDAEGKAAVEYAFTHENWRPSPARLIEIAAELASPIPDADATYDEIMHLADTVGVMGQRHPERPNIRVAGPPEFSHPIVGRVVQYLGGWANLCVGESQLYEGLKKQVRSSWESVARDWRERVRGALRLPPERRDPTLFRAWTPYRLPAGWTPDSSMAAISSFVEEAGRREEEVPLPDHLRGLIKRIGREMP